MASNEFQYKLTLASEVDNSGIEQAGAALAGLEKKLQRVRELNQEAGRIGAEGDYAGSAKLHAEADRLYAEYLEEKTVAEKAYQEALKKTESATVAASNAAREAAAATKSETKAIKENTEAKQENAAATESTAEGQNPLTRSELNQEGFTRLRGSGKTGKNVKKLTGQIKDLGSKAKAAGGRMLGLYGIITAGGEAAAFFLNKVKGAGKGMEDFGADMELTGTAGGKFVSWLGRGITAVGGFGGVIKRTLNPLGAFYRSTKELAAAQRELEATEALVQETMAKRAAKLEKEIKLLKESAAAKRAAEKAAMELKRTQEEWADSIDRVNKSLGHQRELLNEHKIAANDRIDDAERDETAAVDDELERGVITAEEAEKKKYAIFRKYASQREQITRKAFDEEEKIRETERGQQQSIANRNETRKNSLESINRDLLSEEERKGLIKDRKTYLATDDDAAVSDIDAKLARDRGAQEKAKNAGFTDKDTLQKEIDDLAAALESARGKIADIDRRGEVAGLKERNRRDDAVRDFFAENQRRIRGVRESSAKSTAGPLKEGATAAGALDRLASEAKRSGDSGAASAAAEIAAALRDGKVTEQEMLKIGPMLKSLNAAQASAFNGMIGVVQQTLNEQKNIQAQINKLRTQMMNSR